MGRVGAVLALDALIGSDCKLRLGGARTMLKIRVLKDGHLLDTVDAKWTINIAEIAREADKLLPRLGADAWDIVNEDDIAILSKSRWHQMRPVA
jgi:hypothetical protein